MDHEKQIYFSLSGLRTNGCHLWSLQEDLEGLCYPAQGWHFSSGPSLRGPFFEPIPELTEAPGKLADRVVSLTGQAATMAQLDEEIAIQECKMKVVAFSIFVPYPAFSKGFGSG